MATRAGLSRSTRTVGVVLLTAAVLLLAGTFGLALSMLQQTRDLGDKVELTEGIVEAKVRTLSQVQRELLRLKVLLVEESPDPGDVRLQLALVSRRVQEGSLSSQIQTLGTEELLNISRSLAGDWRLRVAPLVRQTIAAADPATLRPQALAGIDDLELGYDQLVSDGETNRKAEAAQANESTASLLSRAERLLIGMTFTFVAIVTLLLLGAVTFARLHRQRERANGELMSLNEDLQRYAHVVESTDNMVLTTDARGLIEWVNPAFARTTGYSLEEAVGQLPGHLLQGPDTDPETVERMGKRLRREDGFTEEVLNYTRGGVPYWVALDVSPMVDRTGQITGFVAVQTDITDRRRSEDLLRSAMVTAEETARAKSEFLASMSHEIRTPLNAVLGLTDLLLLTDLDEGQRDYVRTAHSSGRLLLALVNDILDFSALDAGRIEPERRAFAFVAMVHDTIEMFRADARRRGVDLTVTIADDVPAYVLGDETRLRQILVNLVGNGLKFTHEGSVAVAVRRIGFDPDGARLQIAVTDTGIGIPADRVPYLFQVFTQVDTSTTRKYGGTGLGLAICRLLAERMDGRIEVLSELGVGSSFLVDLVLPAAGAADVPRKAMSHADQRDLSSLRVLLAEDDRVNQTVAVHMLRRIGIEPVVAGDGVEAVALATSGDFDLILMDVHMPVMDGVQATAAIRALDRPGPAPRIVAITANALDGDRERLLAAGMDDYLSKPVQLDALAAAAARAAGALGLATPEQLDTPVVVPAVDARLFREQTGIEEDDILPVLVRGVLDQARRLREDADDLLDEDRLAELRLRAHTVAGASGACAAGELHDVCCALEAACREHDLPGAVADVDRLTTSIRGVEEWLAELDVPVSPLA